MCIVRFRITEIVSGEAKNTARYRIKECHSNEITLSTRISFPGILFGLNREGFSFAMHSQTKDFSNSSVGYREHYDDEKRAVSQKWKRRVIKIVTLNVQRDIRTVNIISGHRIPSRNKNARDKILLIFFCTFCLKLRR